jgi:hypothetical protein
MKQRSWLSSLVAICLLFVCVLGCSRFTEVKKAEPANSNSAANQVATPPADIAGDYDATGTNEDGSPYKGALKVIKRGDVYQFRWTAGRQYDGIGIPNGNVVAVAFTEGSDGKGCGVVSYQLLDDGTLDGKWGYWGRDEMGTELATRTTGSDLSGEYNAIGKNPNGSNYKGTLSITPRAGGYQFAWSNGSSGFGIKQGKAVSVGIGGQRCAFVAYEIKAGGTLEGVWGGYGSTKTGTEKAVKK